MLSAGGTTLVLLPGLDGTDVFLRPLVAALSPTIRSIVVTYPASGAERAPVLSICVPRTDTLDVADRATNPGPGPARAS